MLSDPETGTRYEVEIQLGATDEAHIIVANSENTAGPTKGPAAGRAGRRARPE